MGSVTMTMSEEAHGFLLRSHLGETAGTLADLAGDLPDLADEDSVSDLRREAVRNAVEMALGEITALQVLLDPNAEDRPGEEATVATLPSRLRFGQTAGTLTAVAEDLLWVRDLHDGDRALVVRIDDARAGLGVAFGELIAINGLLGVRSRRPVAGRCRSWPSCVTSSTLSRSTPAVTATTWCSGSAPSSRLRRRRSDSAPSGRGAR